MQDLITAYGVWLLVALAIVIALAVLLKRKGKDEAATPSKNATRLEAAPPAESIEPASPAPPPVASQAQAPAPEPVSAPVSKAAPDNLLQLKGVGPKVNGILVGLGITRFEQIAAWTDEDIARIDSHLGNFSGRVVRDQWVDQASYLARGDKAGFEEKYGKL